MKFMLARPWDEFLRAVDQALTERISVHCLGGFVLSAMYHLPRPTADIDYVEIVPRDAQAHLQAVAGNGSPLAHKHRLYFQNVGVADFPDSYQARLSELPLGLSCLRLFVFDPYDLVLSKLRNSPKDREDIKFLARKLRLKFDVLYQRWEQEMKPWVPNHGRHETTLTVVWREYFD